MTTPEWAPPPAPELPAPPPRSNRRWFVVLAAATALLIGGLAALLAVELGGSSSSSAKPAVTMPVAVNVISAVTTVPATTIAAVGAGNAASASLPQSTGGAPLAATGTPKVLFIGAEFCPFCAAERWAIVNALSRFGTFRGLTQIRSAEYHVATFDFRAAHYTSSYVRFAGQEYEDQRGHVLRHLTTAQERQWETYLPAGSTGVSFPFLDIDGRYVSNGAMVDVEQLLGRSPDQIASQLRDASTPISKTVVGSANQITAAICRVTSNQPASICTPAIQAIGSSFAAYQH